MRTIAGLAALGALLTLAPVAQAQPWPQQASCAPPSRCLFLPAVSYILPTPAPIDGLVNGDFEAGPVGWGQLTSQTRSLITTSAGLPGSGAARSGIYAAWLGGQPNSTTQLTQRVSVPAAKPFLAYWYEIQSSGRCERGADQFSLLVDGAAAPGGRALCQEGNSGGWQKASFDLRSYAGQTVDLAFTVVNNSDPDNSNLFLDDIAFQVNP